MDEDFRLRLRDAVNIIGFFHFPLAWTWDEYRVEKGVKTRPYESEARKASRLNIPITEHEDSEGFAAEWRGQRYRKRRAEYELTKALIRGSVDAFIQDANKRGRRAGERELLDASLRLKIIESLIIFNDASEYIEIDGLHLISHLKDESAPWNARNSTHDWLKLERWMRDYIYKTKFHYKNEELISELLSWWPTQYPNKKEPPRSSLALKAAALRREHTKSDEKIAPSSDDSGASRFQDSHRPN